MAVGLGPLMSIKSHAAAFNRKKTNEQLPLKRRKKQINITNPKVVVYIPVHSRINKYHSVLNIPGEIKLPSLN